MQTGTLQELNVQPGDVVQVLGGKSWEIVGIDNNGNYLINDPPARHLSNTLPFRIISRAPRDDAPTLWRDMSAEEKGALLLAAHEGKVIEHYWFGSWKQVYECDMARYDDCAYRVKPDDVRETVTLYGASIAVYGPCNIAGSTHRITFDTINGEPDPASIRMEKL